MTNELASSSGATIQLTPETISDIAKRYPRKIAMVMQALTMLKYGSVKLTIPGGEVIEYKAPETGPHAEATFHNWGIIRRVFSNGSLGVAESYIEGEWDSPDVTSFLQMFLINAYGGGAENFFNRNLLLNLVNKFNHFLNRNTKRGAKRNISAHYDLGNSFYEQWLDPSMTYSSAIFRDGANSLEEAQEAKYRSLAEMTDIQKDHHVLEIGCGWGGFAEYVAKNIGAKVTCLTISSEQLNYARERIRKAGLDHLVNIKFLDYREETGEYDRIGSIEMFEAVGESYWASYFSQLRDRLKPGGRAGLQVITIRDEDFAHYKSTPDFIQKYIFPGGMLPSVEILERLGTSHDLKQIASRAFGTDYAATLETWRLKFWEKWPTIKPLGFDEKFKRIWEFYFHYCEAGFKADSINVRQMVFQKT